jgi:microcystin-dependent protein
MSNQFLGEIRIFAGNFAPRGWALCQGQLMAIAQNTALFSLLGTSYGGDGRVTFALPDLRGRAPVQQGQGPGLSPYDVGELQGTELASLLLTEMPGHTHLIGVNNVAGTVTDPTDGIAAPINTGTARSPDLKYLGYTAPPANGTMNPAAMSVAGGGQPHNNLQPYVCITYIIATEGIFPSRN